VASIGLAAGAELHTTVMPFILRGVSLLGVNSSAAPRDIRMAVWARLSSDLKPRHLDRIVTRNIGLAELPTAFESYLAVGSSAAPWCASPQPRPEAGARRCLSGAYRDDQRAAATD